MTRILYLSPYFWPEEIGSAPYCSELAFHLAAQGHEVRTVAFRPHYPDIAPFAAWAEGQRDHETHEGVAIERVAVSARGSGGFRERIRNDLRFLRYMISAGLRQKFRGTETIVAYVPSVLTLYGAKIVRLFTGAKIIAVVHDIESGLASSLGITRGGMMPRLLRLIERIGLNFSQTVIVLTDGMARELRDIGCRRPIEVLSIWGSVGPETPIDPGAPKVITYSGNFGKKQNIDQLLPLMERLSRSAVKVDIVLRGNGSERDRIAQEVAARGIGNVAFLPLVPAADLTATLQAANIHLVPQAMNVANYALPSKLFSIMAAGRPFVCIAQADSPLDDLAAKSGAGLCVSPGDDERLYEDVTSLLEDPARQWAMGQAGRAFIRQHMNRAQIFSEYEKLIMDSRAN